MWLVLLLIIGYTTLCVGILSAPWWKQCDYGEVCLWGIYRYCHWVLILTGLTLMILSFNVQIYLKAVKW